MILDTEEFIRGFQISNEHSYHENNEIPAHDQAEISNKANAKCENRFHKHSSKSLHISLFYTCHW